jgi:malate synthase
MEKGIRILAKPPAGSEAVLSREALAFVEKLHRQFQPTRQALLAQRAKRQAEFDAGALPAFLQETASVRTAEWKVADTPPDLQQRWVEITGPSERKMMINALNSGADVFMSDFEDSHLGQRRRRTENSWNS